MPRLRTLHTKFIILVLIFASAALLAACSAPAEKMNQEANQAFAEQAYLEALELYQSAQVKSPQLAEPYFNAANTLYRQGDFSAALEQMQTALQLVDEEGLAESSLYNLGNTLYNAQDLNQAVAAYTQALLLDPNDQEAKYNLELSLQQQQDQQQEENQDQQDESQSQEENQSQESSGEDQESQNSQEQNQGDQSQETDQQDQGNPDDRSEQPREGDPQNQDQQGDGNGQPQEDDRAPDSDQPGQMPPPGQRMTEEQARQLLAAIGSSMETLQERLGQYLFANQPPPRQDW
ncbi:MAG: tetratricopeptide repeat protein [Anaerolineales bacterium]